MRIIIITALFSLIGINQWAQNQWTLQDCINYAYENNLQIKREEIQLKVSKNNYNQSKYERLPNLNFSSGYNKNYGRNVDRYTNEIKNEKTSSSDFGINSSLTLYNGLQIKKNIEANRYNYLMKMKNLEKAKNDISLNIAHAYLQILFSTEILQSTKDQYTIALDQTKKTESLVNVGELTKGELFNIEAQASSDKMQITEAQIELNMSYLNLIQLLEIDSVKGFEITIPKNINELPILDQYNLGIIIEQSKQNMPQIKSAELNLKSADTYFDMAKGERYPRLSLSSGYRTGYSSARDKIIGYDNNNDALIGKYPFSEQLNDNKNYAVGLSLSVPIYNKHQTSKNIKNAKLNMVDAQHHLSQTKQQLNKEVQRAHADAIAANERLISANESVKAYKLAFDYAQQKLNAGIITTNDYNIAKVNLSKAQSNLIRAKFELIFSEKVLDFYLGRELSL